MLVKPSEKEEQYFLEQEAKRLRQLAEKEREAMSSAEKKRLKELHHMHCPKCGQKLATETYGKVEVDVCGHCRGLWLDANELTMILDSEKKTGLLHAFARVFKK